MTPGFTAMQQDAIRFGVDGGGNWLVQLVTVQHGQTAFDTGGRSVELQVVTK